MKQIRVTSLTALVVYLLAAPLSAQTLPLKGNTPDLETMRRNLAGATAMPPNTSLKLQIVLKVRNKDAFDKLADAQNDPNGGNNLATADLYNPASNSFSQTGNMNVARSGHTESASQ